MTVPSTTDTYTLSLHDALPICECSSGSGLRCPGKTATWIMKPTVRDLEPLQSTLATPSRPRRMRNTFHRSEEHTSELQSHSDLVCRLLLEKKKQRDD